MSINITKEDILKKTQGGYTYYVRIFPELRNARINDKRFKNIRNHLRGEKTASLSFYYRNSTLRFHDHGDPDFRGDVFDLYAIINNIGSVKQDFPKIIAGLYNEFSDKKITEDQVEKYKASTLEKATLPDGQYFSIDEISFEKLSNDEIEFINNYQIKQEVFKEYDAIFISAYTFISSFGDTYKKSKEAGQIMLAYKCKHAAKIYKPFDKQYKNHWIGEKPDEYVFGIHLVDDLYNKYHPKNSTESIRKSSKEQIVLCAGEKDTLVARSIGLKSVCLNSETSIYFPESFRLKLMDISDFIDGNLELVIVYDKDRTGKTAADKIQHYNRNSNFSVRIIELPDILEEQGGKDIADWVSLGFSKEELRKLIQGNDSVSPISPISSNSSYGIKNKEEKKRYIEDVGEIEENKTDQENVIIEDTVESYKEINTIDKNLIDNFPESLKNALKLFDGEILIMMLFAFLTAYGSILPNIVARYRNHKFYANLFTIVIAPPASGKSNLKWARQITSLINSLLIKQSEKDLELYKTAKEEIKLNKGNLSKLGDEPRFKVHLIPTDITSPMLVLQLHNNDGYGLMFDTEIDSLVEANDGGMKSFRDYLRKCASCEPITLMRKSEKERILIEQAKMSLLISGTKKQFVKLIPDAENGLFSRIIPFIFKGVDHWVDSFNIDDFDFEKHFNKLGERASEFYDEMTTYSDEPLEFILSKDQLIQMDQVFSEKVKHVKKIAGIDGRASVFRLGGILVRIAMIINTLRRLENNDLRNINICSDQDFQAALDISQIIHQHIFKTLKMMNEERIEACFRGKKLDYYCALNNEFTYGQSQEVAQELNIRLRTAQKWLYDFRDKGFLVNPQKGQFRKVG